MAKRIVLHSPLAPVALATELRDVLGDRKKPPSGKGVTGQGSDSEMMLFFYRPNIQNSFATRLVATMTPESGGTRIEGKIGAAGLTTVFMGCWFGFLLIFAGIAAVGMIATHTVVKELAVFVAIPGTMAALGGLMWWLGTHNGAADRAAILDFLAQTVDARSV